MMQAMVRELEAMGAVYPVSRLPERVWPLQPGLTTGIRGNISHLELPPVAVL